MDGEMLRRVYHRLFKSDSGVPRAGCVYCDAVVVLVHVLAALTNHSHFWAHDKRNWPLWARRLAVPSYSQLMRRLKTPQVAALIASVNAEFRAALPDGVEKVCDGKPLVVSGFSKDPDVRRGRACGEWHKGYKLHVLSDAASAGVDAFEVTALDGGEPTVMRTLVARVELRGKTLRGDSNYDSNELYRLVANAGGRLVATRKKPGTGLGHHAQHPDRVQAIGELEGGAADALKHHDRHRVRVEQHFAQMTNVSFGFWSLPNFVRRLPRVRAWIGTKVMLYHLYRSLTLARDLAA